MKTVVIRRRELPVSAPLTFSVVVWLFLDRVHAVGWIWGVAASVVVLLWIAFFHALWTEEEVSAFSPGAADKARQIRERAVIEQGTKL